MKLLQVILNFFKNLFKKKQAIPYLKDEIVKSVPFINTYTKLYRKHTLDKKYNKYQKKYCFGNFSPVKY